MDWPEALARARPSAAGRRTAIRPSAAGAPCRIGNSRQMSSNPISPLRPTSQPRRRFSSTVSDGNSRRPSGTSMMPEATMASVCGRRCCRHQSDVPSTRSAWPTMALSSVDLPAPLAPMMETISPASTAMIDMVDRAEFVVENRNASTAKSGLLLSSPCRITSRDRLLSRAGRRARPAACPQR